MFTIPPPCLLSLHILLSVGLLLPLFPYHGFEFFIKPRHIHDVVGLQEIQHFRRVLWVVDGLGNLRFALPLITAVVDTLGVSVLLQRPVDPSAYLM